VTGTVHASPRAETGDAVLRRLEQKRRAVERLLDWGFEPSAIARMLGCSTQWIDTIRKERSEELFS
jgi:hypothetical protein